MNLVRIIILLNQQWRNFLSALMKGFLRLNGAKIGKSTYISFSSRIVGKKVVIGDDVFILDRVMIKGNEITIGNSCTISNDCFISGSHSLNIGDKTYLGKKARIDLSRDVVLGTDVGFGENSIIWTHGYFPPADEGYPVTYGPVEIGDSAWVSTGIIVLPGVKVGKKAIIGAGSVLTKSVPDDMVAAGNPAKVIKNVVEIKNDRGFMVIMEEIMDGYKTDSRIAKNNEGGVILYNYGKYSIALSEDYNVISKRNFPKGTLILSKKILRSAVKDYFYFDFEDKTRIRSNNKNVLDLDFYLMGFGIRFLKEDND